MQRRIAFERRHLVMEAGDQVVAHVEGREAAAERGVDGIDGLGQSGGLVNGFGPCVAGQHFDTVGAVVDGGFEGVVGGVGNGALQLYAAECGAELGARGLLIERSAGWGETEAKRWVGGVGFFKHEQVMRGCADVAESDHGCGSELTLQAGHPVLGVGAYIFGIDGGNADEGFELGPVDCGVGVGAACAVGYFL
jgi:hypothetical protein